MLINENRWRAQRYGTDQGLVDFGRGIIVPFPTLLEEILSHVREDAESLQCVDEVEHALVLLQRFPEVGSNLSGSLRRLVLFVIRNS